MADYQLGHVLTNKQTGQKVQLTEAGWEPVADQRKEKLAAEMQHQPSPALTMPDPVGLGRSFTEGQTLGLGDEAGLGIASLAGSARSLGGDIKTQSPAEVYRQMREEYNRRQGKFEQEHPVAATAANIAGGALTTVPGVKSLMGSKFAQASPLKASAMAGGGMGVVSGAGYAPTLGDVPTYAATGLIGGAGAGTIMPLVARPLMKGAGMVKSMLTPEMPQTKVSRTVGEFMGRDIDTPQQLIAKAQGMGPQTTLADVAGANVQAMSGAAITKSGAMKDIAAKQMAERQSGSTKRLMGSLKSLSGGDSNFFSRMDSKIKGRAAEAGPLYKEAMGGAIPEEAAHGLHARINDAAGGMAPLKKWVKRFTVGKKDNRQVITSVKDLHSLQQELRDESSALFRKGKNNQAIAVKKMHGEVIDLLSDSMPDTYGKARKIYADDSAVMDAMNAGRNILKEEVDEVSSNISRLSQAEQESYINGAVKTIRDRLMGGAGDKNAATKLASQLVRERLRPAFPDDKSFKTFVDRLDIEDEYAKTYQKMFGGSPTQPRAEAARDLEAMVKGGVDIQGQDAISAVKNAAMRALDLDRVPQVVIDDISRLMFTPINQIPKKQLDSLLKHGVSAQSLRNIQSDIADTLGASAGMIATQQGQRAASR